MFCTSTYSARTDIIPINCHGLQSILYMYSHPFTESRSIIKRTSTSPDSQKAVGDYYGVQHDIKELRMGPKRID